MTRPLARSLGRVIQLPAPARGQFGPHHTVVEVLKPETPSCNRILVAVSIALVWTSSCRREGEVEPTRTPEVLSRPPEPSSESIPRSAGQRNDVDASSHEVPPPAAPEGGAPLSSSGAVVVHSAEDVVRYQIFPGAKECYRRALQSGPTQEGKLVISIKISPSGDVDTATVYRNGGLTEDALDCIIAVARRARFDAPGPAGSQISIPFNFMVSRNATASPNP